ncbi:MAG: hypothetical protein E6K63_04195 [Nitrospirae bacterium]|jgi:hypothetical protein|nr:MAG: hypothetical protein E6K63_04195 [Nitrospirota bacterium]
MDPGQRKRLADICEKLGVALFAGAAIQAIVVQSLTLRLIVSAFLAGAVGLSLLAFAVLLSKGT